MAKKEDSKGEVILKERNKEINVLKKNQESISYSKGDATRN
jgi:hypothetical protein